MRSRDRLSDAASGKRLPATSLRSIICLLAAENHPRIRAQLRAEDWREEKHLAIRVEGTAHGDMDKLLDEHHMPRRIALTLPSF